MDLPEQDLAELAGHLPRYPPGQSPPRRDGDCPGHLPLSSPRSRPTQAISVLDLATGSGDIPLAISRWAKRKGLAMTIVASDFSEPILREARKLLTSHPKITLARYDARAVPLPDK